MQTAIRHSWILEGLLTVLFNFLLMERKRYALCNILEDYLETTNKYTEKHNSKT